MLYFPSVQSAFRTEAEMIHKLTPFRRQHPMLHSICRGLLGFLLSESLSLCGDKIGISLRHGRGEDPRFKYFARQHPAFTVFHGSVISPIVEEAIFRYVPSCFLDRRGQYGLELPKGALISLIFAASHSGPFGIPVPQFISGLNYWEIQRIGGFKYAVIAHSTRNTLGAAYHFYKWHTSH
jgi:membrane protease YdiL (CAAX protease family)